MCFSDIEAVYMYVDYVNWVDYVDHVIFQNSAHPIHTDNLVHWPIFLFSVAF